MYKFLDTRTTYGHTGVPVVVVDVLLDGAVLPVSQPWTSYSPSAEELDARSYKDLHVPGHMCPRCGFVLTVNEKVYKTVGSDKPYYMRRLSCPGFFVSGCNYLEPFTDAIREQLSAPAVEVDHGF